MKHGHRCPDCGKVLPCTDPAECAKAKTRGVVLLCEPCARRKVEGDNEYRCAQCHGVFEKPWTDEGPISWEVGGRSGWSPWKGLADLGGRTAFTDEINPMQNFMVPHVPGATMRVMARGGSFEYKLGTTPHLIHVPFHVMIPG